MTMVTRAVGEVIRIGRAVAVLAVVALVAGVSASAGAGSHQATTEPRVLAPGVSLSLDESHVEAYGDADGLIEAHVTLSNNGETPLKVGYFTFSLVAANVGRSLALLPSELGGRVAAPFLLSDAWLTKGQTMKAVLYFRSPSSDQRSIALRVDLSAAGGRLVSRTFLPLRLTA